MAISLHTEGSWVAANAITQTVTLPTHSTGDLLIVRAGMKHATLPGDITCDQGFTQIDEHNNGTTASGNGTGDVQIVAFYKVATSASETNPTLTFHASVAATPSCAVATSFSKGATEQWVNPVGDSGSIAAATSYTATMASHISATAGDWLVGFSVTNDNTTLTVPTITQTGLTLAAVVESPATALSSATSNDISADGCYRSVTSGTSSAAAVFTGTNSVADVGAAMVIRLRVEAIPPPSGTGAITVPAATVSGTGVLSFTATGAVTVPSATVAGTGAEIFQAIGSTFLLPDSIVSQSQFAGATVAEFQTEDADIAAATGTSAAVRLSFPTPDTTPRTGGTSRLEALIYAGTSDTTTTVEYHESGSLVLSSGSIVVPANTNRWISLDIPNASLSDLAGGQARITLNVTGAGVDIVRWLIDAGMSGSAPTVSGTGDHTLSAPSGTGAITVPAATVAGTGTHTPNPTGTGAISVTAPTIVGAGELVVSGTGAVSAQPSIVDGTGAEILTATGAITGQVPTVSGDGLAANPVSGTGSISGSAPTVTGAGLHTENVTGTGSIAVPTVTVVGGGLHTENVTGTGAIQMPAPVVTGTGIQVLTGSGAITIQAPTINGTGDHSEAIPVTGTGAITVPSATVAGVGVFGAVETGIVRIGKITGSVSSNGARSGSIVRRDKTVGSIT